MNSITLVGNVGQNPSLRETSGGTPVANVSLATNNVYKDREGNRQQTTEWHRLVIWGEGAKNFAEIVGKGDLVSVRGRLEYKPREIAGEKLKDAVIRVEEWHQLTPRKAQSEAAAAQGDPDGDGLQAKDEIPFGGGEAEIPAGGSLQESAALGGEDLPATADPEPAEGAGVAPGEEVPTETAPAGAISAEATPEEDASITRARRRRK